MFATIEMLKLCSIVATTVMHVLSYAAKDISFEVPEKLFRGERMSKSILIADDHETTRSLIRSFLESKDGFEVCGEAVDGVDVIQKAKALKPDLIILDLAMPRMNGAAAASILKRMMPKVPIIFTMYDEAIGKALASAVHVDLVLAKPNGLSEMVTHVHDLLGSE
jgi:DNA-binding NarL/FixJ family response regulator